MNPIKRIGTAMAVSMLMAVTLLGMTGSSAAAQDNGLSEVQATVASVMGADVAAQGHQVNAKTMDYNGFTATKTVLSADLICSYKYLCMVVRGTTFSFTTCQLWTVSNWYGTGPWENNQTRGTVARYYGASGNELVNMRSTAYSEGTADWGPVYSLRPC
ncbi:hypothetical protein ABZ707_07350 [Streptomyces sp. NPDC006923]|uniref:hypothetical protein n=1 Tax=Streptomyces sp. NPDC006923 TaxID=3155355 RepID=UPI00341137E3